MFVVHEELHVTTGMQAEAEARITQGHEMMKNQKGFAGAYVIKFSGNATKYLAIRMWDSKDAYEGWGRSSEREAYMKARPEGLYSQQPLIENYEVVAETRP
ncbi:MAG: hypothetical protein HW403_1064 [Dehalococcoidia bacterium]|nr:hypothetical protein [Dehalococcoidia bacterium]